MSNELLSREAAYEANVLSGWRAMQYGATATNSNGLWRKAAGNGTYTWGLSEGSLPMGATGYVRVDSANATAASNNIAQNDTPLVVGETYTVGCYVRGRGVADIFLEQDGNARIARAEVDGDRWRFVSGTFTAKATPQNFYLSNGTSSSSALAGALDICAPLLVRGGVASMILCNCEVTITDETDIDSLVTWHKWSSSATLPSAPTTTQTTQAVDGWQTVEPGISTEADAAGYVYSVLQTRWKDGSCTWGAVSMSASFEAAKTAWNKAHAVQASLDGLEIGGRNYVLGTTGERSWATSTGTYDLSDALNGLSASDSVCLSFDIKSTMAQWADAYYVSAQSGGSSYNNANNPFPAIQIAEANKWYRVSWEGDAGKNVANAHCLRIRSNSSEHGSSTTKGTVTVRNLKLEKGDKATSWTPAPEDIDLHFESVETAIDRNSEAIKLAATKEEVDKTYSTKEEARLDRSGSGTSVAIENAASATLKALHILGESIQDGTPTPEAPIPIASVSPPNLSPFFSHDFDDTSYWKTRHANYSQLDDGWAHFEGDRTSVASNATYYFAVEPLDGLVAGDTYTVLTELRNLDSSVATTDNSVRTSYSARQLNATSALGFATVTRDHAAYYQQVTVADPSATELIRGRAYVYAGNRLSFDIRISVYKGAYKEPYVPCDSIGTFIRGKNLFGPRTTSEGTAGGIDWSIDESGTCVMSGTATSASTFTPVANVYLPEGTYTLSASDGHEVQFDGVIGQYVTKTFDSKWDVSLAKVYVRNGTAYSGSFTVQLERGDTATEYEPYNGTIISVPLNGHELCSLPDGTQDELTIDVDGHVTMTQRVGIVAFTLDGGTVTGSGGRSPNSHGLYSNYVTYTTAAWSALGVGDFVSNSSNFIHFQMSNYGMSEWYVSFADAKTAGIAALNSTSRLYLRTATSMTEAQVTDAVSAIPVVAIGALATPQTIDLGTIDMPQVQDGDTIEVIAAVTPSIDATWWATAGQAVADAYANLSSAIEVRAESIVSTVASTYATSEVVQSISTQIEQTATGWTAKFNQLTGGEDLTMTLAEAFESLGVTSANLEQIRSFVRITTDPSGDPLLLMGSATSPIMLALSNDSLEFRHGADRVAYIDVDSGTNEGMLHITRAVVVKELQFGSWKWFEREGVGNMALKWVGEEA